MTTGGHTLLTALHRLHSTPDIVIVILSDLGIGDNILWVRIIVLLSGYWYSWGESLQENVWERPAHYECVGPQVSHIDYLRLVKWCHERAGPGLLSILLSTGLSVWEVRQLRRELLSSCVLLSGGREDSEAAASFVSTQSSPHWEYRPSSLLNKGCCPPQLCRHHHYTPPPASHTTRPGWRHSTSIKFINQDLEITTISTGK